MRPTDIAEHRTADGISHLCPVEDVFSIRIAGHSIDSMIKARLTMNAMIGARKPAGTILQSDRASQFRSMK